MTLSLHARLLRFVATSALLLSGPVLLAQAGAQVPMPAVRVAFIDTDGGQATLLVSPAGRSMLIDTGYAGNPGAPAPVPTPGAGGAPPPARDADRIMAALSRFGITVLDYVVITHYHGDHVGGAADLAARIPIRHFVDHGNYTVELQPTRVAGFVAYQTVRGRARVIVPKPGDTIPFDGVEVRVVSGAGALLRAPWTGAARAGLTNPLCRTAVQRMPDPTPENQESLGLVIRFGRFRMLDLGDLTWNQEHALACPVNLLGTFDLFHTTRHGDINSGAPQMVHAIRPRVALMNNGERKGGAPEYWRTLRASPGLEDLWQLHRSAAGGATENAPDAFLANVSETDHGYAVTLTARADGGFTMTNGRTGFTKDYAARPAPAAATTR